MSWLLSIEVSGGLSSVMRVGMSGYGGIGAYLGHVGEERATLLDGSRGLNGGWVAEGVGMAVRLSSDWC